MLQWLKNKFKKKKEVEPLPIKVTEFELEIPWIRNGVCMVIYNGGVRPHNVTPELFKMWRGGLSEGEVLDIAWSKYQSEVRMLDRQVNRRYYEMGGK